MLHIRLRHFHAANFFVFSKDLKKSYFHTIFRAFLFTMPNISASLFRKQTLFSKVSSSLLVEVRRFELLTYGLQSRRSPS